MMKADVGRRVLEMIRFHVVRGGVRLQVSLN
jgi:hypothetical protein